MRGKAWIGGRRALAAWALALLAAGWGLLARAPGPAAAAPPRQVPPTPLAASAAAQAFLPQLAGPSRPCEDQAVVAQNLGPSPSKVILVAWAPSGAFDCFEPCPGPLKVECGGLIRPGASWTFTARTLPAGAASAALYHVTAKTLREIGVELGFDDVVADYLCQTMFFNLVGDCDAYDGFRAAWDGGQTWQGVPLERATGGALAVDVQRRCAAGALGPEAVAAQAGYAAPSGLDLGTAADGRWQVYVPDLALGAAGLWTTVSAQNAGTRCATVELWFQPAEECSAARRCGQVTLRPGEAWAFDPQFCGGPNLRGSGRLLADQPLAVVADSVTARTRTSARGIPEGGESPETGTVLFGPMIFSEYAGWSTEVVVQNLSPDTDAKVKVYFQDRSGDIITTLVDMVCPLGSRVFALEKVAGLPGNWIGDVRVESQAWWSPSDPPPGGPPRLAGTIRLLQAGEGGLVAQAVGYNLVPAVPAAVDAPGLWNGPRVLALPQLVKAAEAGGRSTELAITNLVTKPGFTDFAIFIYDQNGLLDYVCQKLNEKQVEYIDLERWGYVNRSFRGSAVVSAHVWEHHVFGPNGEFLYNLVGLGGTVLERDRAAAPARDLAGGSEAVHFDPAGLLAGGALVRPCPSGPFPPPRTPSPGASPMPTRTATPTGPRPSPGLTATPPDPTRTPGHTATPAGRPSPAASATPTPDGRPSEPLPTPTRVPATSSPPSTRRPVFLPFVLLARQEGPATPAPTDRPWPTSTAPRPTATPDAWHTALPTPTPAGRVPRPDALHLPSLANQGPDAVCRASIAVQNVGAEPGKAVLLTWSDPGLCPPNCAGPLKVECSGLIRPGASWTFDGRGTATGALSGSLFSFTALKGSEVGIPLPGGDDVVADLLCERLFFDLVGDCAAYSAFKAAYDAGADYAGLPLGRAWGPALAATVLRVCPGDVTASRPVLAAYAARPQGALGPFDPVAGGRLTYLPGILSDVGDLDSFIYLQNAGTDCASVEVWFKAEADCQRAKVCEILTIAPGEARPVDVYDCVGRDWRGGAWIRSTEPIAVLQETMGRDSLADASGAAVVHGRVSAAADTRLFGPLVYQPESGWDLAVTVRNASASVNAQVRVDRLRADGLVLQSRTEWVCPQGDVTLLFPASGAAEPSPGSVRVTSLPWRSRPEDPWVTPPDIVGTAHLRQLADGGGSPPLGAASYTLLPAGAVRSTEGAAGAGRVGLPLVQWDPDGTGLGTEIAVTNVADGPGRTGFRLQLYDANGPVASYCWWAASGETKVYAQPTIGHVVARGFHGAAVVSATWSEQPGLGLAAVAVQRPLGSPPASLADGLAIEPGAPFLGPLPGEPACPGPTPTPGR